MTASVRVGRLPARPIAAFQRPAWEADSSDDSDDEDPWGEKAGKHLVNLVLDLVYVGKLSANDDELDEEAMEADEDFGYIVGWDPEHNNAWRMATTAASPTRTPSSPPVLRIERTTLAPGYDLR